MNYSNQNPRAFLVIVKAFVSLREPREPLNPFRPFIQTSEFRIRVSYNRSETTYPFSRGDEGKVIYLYQKISRETTLTFELRRFERQLRRDSR